MSDMKNKSCATPAASAMSKKSSNGKFRISFNQDYTYVMHISNLNRYNVSLNKNGSV